MGTEQHWKERIGTSAEGRGETGEKRDREEKRDGEDKTLHACTRLCIPYTRLCMPYTRLCMPATRLCMPMSGFWSRFGLISKVVGSHLGSKSENRLINLSRWVFRLHFERFS